MKYCISLIAVAAALLLPVSVHSFCFQPQPRLVCAEYFDSKIIVEATLVRIGGLRDPDYPAAYLSTITPCKSVKPYWAKVIGPFTYSKGMIPAERVSVGSRVENICFSSLTIAMSRLGCWMAAAIPAHYARPARH